MQKKIFKWIPALFMMSIIFWFSSRSGDDLPNFDWADTIVKKSGHMIGYALLAVSYWYAQGLQMKNRRIAWLLAVLFAATDEFHQTFTQGRHPSIWDILIFDNLGAWLGLLAATRFLQQKRPDEGA